MSKWQPIETAQKTAERKLAWCLDEFIIAGKMHYGRQNISFEERFFQAFAHGSAEIIRYYRGQWVLNERSDPFIGGKPCTPTHWMPLPKPPEAK